MDAKISNVYSLSVVMSSENWNVAPVVVMFDNMQAIIGESDPPFMMPITFGVEAKVLPKLMVLLLIAEAAPLRASLIATTSLEATAA